MKGIWLLPTRRRLAKLREFLLACTATGITTPGLILIQEQEYEELVLEYAELPLPTGWSIYATKSEGFCNKTRELYPATTDLDWVGFLCDDLAPRTYLWDQLLLENLNGKNVVSCDDAEQAPNRMAGACVWSGDLMRAVGYICPPGFWHTYVDNVWEDLGRVTGSWDIRMDVLITHDHGFLSGVEQDATHRAAYDKYHEDEAAYSEWRLIEFPRAVQRILALKGLKLPEVGISLHENLTSPQERSITPT